MISGPYRGNVEHNIIMARRAAVKLWKAGWAVICPHMNTANFDGECPDDVWLEGDLEFLRRVDAIYMLKAWRSSKGAMVEHQKAIEWGKQIIYE